MKKYIFNHYLLFIITGVLIFLQVSCKKDLLEKSPITELSGDVLKTEADFTALLNSAYNPLGWQVINGAQTHMYPVMWQDIRADNCLSQWAAYWTFGAPLDDLRNIKANNTNIAAMWKKWYTAIARANTAIKFITDFGGFTTAGLKERLLAEAKFVRAFSYFELVKNFGDVPLIINYIGSTSDELKYSRSPKVEVYVQIEKDLGEAVPVLPASYSNPNDKGRATKGTALTLLAKAELYQKKYDKVRQYTELVMALGYKLETNFSDNWSLNNEYGKESIFEIGYVAGLYNNPFESADAYKNKGTSSYQMFGFIFNGAAGGFGNCVPRKELIKLYQTGDTRRDATIIDSATYFPEMGVTGWQAGIQYYQYFWTAPEALQSLASARKYTIISTLAPTFSNRGSFPLNEKVFRYSDVLLMHAEAAVISGGDGLNSLNQVIARAYGNTSHNLSSYTLADVKIQRRLELATEGWDRFTDLVRWGDAASALAFKHFKTGRDELLPIPQTEIDLVGAATLSQNPNY